MKLEKFIESNKSSFEEELPEGIWAKIDKELPKKKSSFLVIKPAYIRIAAGVLICLSIGYWFGKSGRNQEGQFSEIASENKSMALFSSQIKEKQESLQILTKENPELGKAFLNEIGQLQTNFKYLEEQLKSNPNHDQIVEAMIQNLRWQLELLEKQTNIARKFENKTMM
jgi:uncharacterized membrane protein YraQ (UPF0718 family)